MTASISQFSRPLDFGNLSNGQRARVNIALSFAFRDVLQSIHTRVNVCMLDEILDVGLDAIGVTSAAKMLKRKSREENISLYIISHRDEIDSAFDRRMTVQMSKGFSYINEEE
jgi:DNA repair exonuclease SbcCD ATPase subunit